MVIKYQIYILYHCIRYSRIAFYILAESTSEPYVTSATTAPPLSATERKRSAPAIPPIVTQQPPSAEASSDEDDDDEDDEDENDAVGASAELGAQSTSNQRSRSQSIQLANKAKFGSKGALHSPVGSAHSFDLQVSCRSYC